MWKSQDQDTADLTVDGMIDMEIGISHKKKTHHNELAMNLMNLASAGGADQEELGYINKNLYTFFDIQLYSNIWVGS